MPQSRETGQEGNRYGHTMARGLARLLRAKRVKKGSNEVIWNGRRAVLKSASPRTTSIGITTLMLERLEVILAAFEDGRGVAQLYELSPETFRRFMYDSRSASAAGGRVKLMRRVEVERRGRPMGGFPVQKILEAAEESD
jgi:hypothetical protein